MNSTPLRGLVLVIAAAFAICCGGDASLSPTAPSGGSVIRQTGAVIVGQVNSASAPATPRSTTGMSATAATLATLDSAAVKVKVVGTNISTTTKEGQFTLTGVPPGDVQLEFTGRGGSATISISGVRADQEIQIFVTLNGNNARVDSERRNKRGDGSGNGEDQPELKGAVSGLTGNCPRVSFTVRGTKVTTSETTQFDGVRCADFMNDMVVEVKGSRQSDNSIAATRVEIEDDDEDDNRNGSSRITTRVEVKGAVSGLIGTCPKLSFMVGESAKVNTSESTRFDDVRCDVISDRMFVEVTGVRQSDGSINATEVEIDD